MEAIFAPSATEQSFSPYKHTKKHPSKRNTRDFTVSRSTENLAPTNYFIHGGNGGLFFAPPPPSISFSYPPPSPLIYPHQQIQKQPAAQPPLLPLPISRPRHHSLPSRSGGDLSSPPIVRKSNRPRDQSLTPKKSKNPIDRRDGIKRAQSMIGSSTVPSGPDPNDLPKDVSKVLSSLTSSSSFSSMAVNDVNSILEDLERFSGSVFTPSPHPSSLPLPKFVKPKLSCTAEAAVTDTGATDNLRRLLRLR